MNGIKKMLLGIAIMMAVIVFHMFCADGLVTDLIAMPKSIFLIPFIQALLCQIGI